MREIEKIRVFSAAKISGIISAILGFIIIVVYVLFLKIAPLAGIAPITVGAALSTIVVGSIFYGIIGFIGGALYAWFYNLITKYTKGIEIELK